MDVKLVVQKSGRPGQTFHLRSAEMILGRQKGCGVRIPSAEVSRQHCLLSFGDDLLSVEDLSSANGTFLNGRRISRREFVRPGDKLRVGPVTLLVQYQLTQAAVDRLLQEDEQVPVISALDDVEVLPEFDGGEGGEVELVLEENEGPLVADEPLDMPVDPMDALRAIEDQATTAPPPPPTPKKKASGARKPSPPAPVPDNDDDLITISPEPPPRIKLTDANAPTAPAASAEPEEDLGDEPSPDASQILGHKNWQLPTGEDIRDILAQIEKGKKKS